MSNINTYIRIEENLKHVENNNSFICDNMKTFSLNAIKLFGKSQNDYGGGQNEEGRDDSKRGPEMARKRISTK